MKDFNVEQLTKMAGLKLSDYHQRNKFAGQQKNELSKYLKDYHKARFPLLSKEIKLDYTKAEKAIRAKRMRGVRLTEYSFKMTREQSTPKAKMKKCIRIKRVMQRPNSKVQRNGWIIIIVYGQDNDSMILRNSEGLAFGITENYSELENACGRSKCHKTPGLTRR